MATSRKILYRAGTEFKCPSFVGDAVWLIVDPNLYYPLGQDQESSPNTRADPTVFLWKTNECPKTMIENHPKFKGVYMVKEKEGVGRIEFLKSLKWEKCEVPSRMRNGPGMSVMDFNVSVQAVLEYMIDNPPETPEDFNFLAELKAASHWEWLDDDEPLELVPGPHDNRHLRKVLKVTLKTWKTELKELKTKQTAKGKQDLGERDSSCDDDYKRISDLEDYIFSLTMYYRGTLEESDDDSSTAMDSPELCVEGDNSRSCKSPKVKVPPSTGHKYPYRTNGFAYHN